jgi:hypothetical protein
LRTHFNPKGLMNRIMYELGVARQAELLRFSRGFPGVDHPLLPIDREIGSRATVNRPLGRRQRGPLINRFGMSLNGRIKEQ